jgi:hypothetical protein
MHLVEITQSVSHDRYHLHQGEVVKLPNAVANTLVELGFAKETDEPADEAEDLVGGKMDSEEINNKMEAEPKNKAIKTPKAD